MNQPEQDHMEDKQEERLISALDGGLTPQARARVWDNIEPQIAAQPRQSSPANSFKQNKRDQHMTSMAMAQPQAQDKYWSPAAAAAVLAVVCAGLFWMVSPRHSVSPLTGGNPQQQLGGAPLVKPAETKDPKDEKPVAPAPPDAPREVPEWEKQLKEKLQKKVTFDFKDTGFGDAVSFLTTVLQVESILVDQALKDKPVSLRVSDMSGQAAVSWICKLAGAKWELKAHAIVISSAKNAEDHAPAVAKGEKPVEAEWEKQIKEHLQRKVTFEFVDTSLGDAVWFLGGMGKITIVWLEDRNIRDTPVSLRAQDLPLEIALEQLCLVADVKWYLQDEALVIRSANPKPEPAVKDVKTPKGE
jgi:hypothetical protein